MIDNTILISGAVVFKKSRGRTYWFITKTSSKEGEIWEIPKVVVRKTESSVRASIRMIGEKGGINAKVLEEVGRAGGSTTVNGKKVPQRYIYYLMGQIIAGEAVGFEDSAWLEYAKAVRQLSLKREQQMLREARIIMRRWRKDNPDWLKIQKAILAEIEEKSK